MHARVVWGAHTCRFLVMHGSGTLLWPYLYTRMHLLSYGSIP